MQLNEDKYKVYAELDNNQSIINIFSDAFQKPDELKLSTRKQILLDDGTGDRYKHAQNNYLGSIYDDMLRPKFYINEYYDSIMVRSEMDLETLYPITVDLTEEDILNSKILYMEMLAGIENSNVVQTMILVDNYSLWYNTIKHFYTFGLWTDEMVKLAVTYNRITQAECDTILTK